MTRKTSIDAYNMIKDNGMLSKRRWEVYEVLFKKGPLTGNEVILEMKKEGRGARTFDSNSHSRLSELRNFGVIYEVRTRKCTVTGMTVIEWDVNDKLPVKFEKSKKEKCKICNGKGFVVTQQAKFDIK